MAKKKAEEAVAEAPVEKPKAAKPAVVAPTNEQLEGLKADIADATEKVEKGKAMIALVEPRIAHLSGVVDRIREASTPEKQAARFEEAEKMVKGLFKD